MVQWRRRRSVPGKICKLRGGEGQGGGAEAGRQRQRTRLYPVEISRALKSSESMLPVCFCSQDAGIAEARPRGGPMCTAEDRTVEKQGDRRPRDQVRGKVSRDVREEAREPGDSTGCQGWVVSRREERERRAVNVSLLGPRRSYLPVILHVVAQADEAGLELLRPQCPAMVLPGGHRRQANRVM